MATKIKMPYGPSYLTNGTRKRTEQIGKILKCIRESEELGHDDIVELEDGITAVIGEDCKALNFEHPIIHEEKAYVDLRPYYRRGQVRNQAEVNLMVRRAKIDLEWTQDVNVLYNFENFITAVFARWIENQIGQKLSVSIRDGMKLRILFATYYMGFFADREETYDVRELDNTIRYKLTRWLNIPDAEIDNTVGSNETLLPSIYGIEKDDRQQSGILLERTIKQFNTSTDNIYQLDTTGLYGALINGAFISANAREMTMVAIENPACFTTMMSYVGQRGIYAKTTIGRAYQQVVGGKRFDDKTFLRTFG